MRRRRTHVIQSMKNSPWIVCLHGIVEEYCVFENLLFPSIFRLMETTKQQKVLRWGHSPRRGQLWPQQKRPRGEAFKSKKAFLKVKGKTRVLAEEEDVSNSLTISLWYKEGHDSEGTMGQEVSFFLLHMNLPSQGGQKDANYCLFIIRRDIPWRSTHSSKRFCMKVKAGESIELSLVGDHEG